MNLNPLTWLLVLAPAAVIGALLFVWVYQSNSSTADLERDRMRLESMEFDRDAAAAWNEHGGQGATPLAHQREGERRRRGGSGTLPAYGRPGRPAGYHLAGARRQCSQSNHRPNL